MEHVALRGNLNDTYLLTPSLSKPRQNTAAILKYYELFFMTYTVLLICCKNVLKQAHTNFKLMQPTVLEYK
jgi:hypothetical protein